ncbi:hypothetical protein HYH03_008378 [Edaphochlamys debaryana]|uniref:Uncharacterized protein n=1 Tax=Edaphochlamys debaryana TaxID=47281 RepID=A0A835Y9M8_9CHLO|nr:hypothetical protein HYH03_008378 [Edaphochlamys debaryana]|eukprot:KAG2493564.1 hypothetical protein HYH03_008378 [Edaphochlamys debaryana]
MANGPGLGWAGGEATASRASGAFAAEAPSAGLGPMPAAAARSGAQARAEEHAVAGVATSAGADSAASPASPAAPPAADVALSTADPPGTPQRAGEGAGSTSASPTASASASAAGAATAAAERPAAAAAGHGLGPADPGPRAGGREGGGGKGGGAGACWSPGAGGSGGGPAAAALLAAGAAEASASAASVAEAVSREVIRKLRLAVSAGSTEDRHVVCEELFADITCPLDAAAEAALGGGRGGSTPARGGRGRLYYEVLSAHYASRAAADSARAVLHLCQLLWDTPWVAPTYALLLHRFLLLPKGEQPSPPASAAGAGPEPAAPTTPSAASSPAASPAGAGAGSGPGPLSGQRVRHLHVLAHGTRQLLLGDVAAGLFRFQPLWACLALEVALGQPPHAPGGGGGAAAPLPAVSGIDALPPAARPWLLAVGAAFLPYYCRDEQAAELARSWPPPRAPAGAGGGGGGGGVWGSAGSGVAGLDFLLVEVADTLGRINSEVGLLKYLRALASLARTSEEDEDEDGGGGGGGTGEGRGGSRSPRPRPRGAPTGPLLAGVPTMTRLRLQSELYALTSGGGPRYAPPEVRRAAFVALDALWPSAGGRALRKLVRWVSATLHLEWLDGGSGAGGGGSSGGGGSGWIGWLTSPVGWWAALYGRLLLLTFHLLYGIVVWSSWRRGAAGDAAGAIDGPDRRGRVMPAPAGTHRGPQGVAGGESQQGGAGQAEQGNGSGLQQRGGRVGARREL